jgi:hypothetical protein
MFFFSKNMNMDFTDAVELYIIISQNLTYLPTCYIELCDNRVNRPMIWAQIKILQFFTVEEGYRHCLG